MKLAVLKENMQSLFNAVVIQAADDYREATVSLMEKPDNANALAMLEECRSFFLSEDFCAFTSVPGPDILHRLEREQAENRKQVEAFRELKAELAKVRQAFAESKYSDEESLKSSEEITGRLKDMCRQAKGQWKRLFRLERKDKKMIQEIENWRRELKWQKAS